MSQYLTLKTLSPCLTLNKQKTEVRYPIEQFCLSYDKLSIYQYQYQYQYILIRSVNVSLDHTLEIYREKSILLSPRLKFLDNLLVKTLKCVYTY